MEKIKIEKMGNRDNSIFETKKNTYTISNTVKQ